MSKGEKYARAKRAKILFFIVKYANLWGFCCCRRRGCLSSLFTSAALLPVTLKPSAYFVNIIEWEQEAIISKYIYSAVTDVARLLNSLVCIVIDKYSKRFDSGEWPINFTNFLWLKLLFRLSSCCLDRDCQFQRNEPSHFFFHLDLRSGFQMAIEKSMPKCLLWPITTGANSTMNQSNFLAVSCHLLKALEKARAQRMWTVLVCFSPACWKTGAKFLSLSLQVAITIA